MKIFANFNEHEFEYESVFKDELYHLLYNNKACTYDAVSLGGGRYSLLKDGKSFLIHLQRRKETYHVLVNGEYFELHVEDERTRKVRELVQGAQSGPGELIVRAPIPGVVIKIHVQEGDLIAKGEPLLILEAMKMENIIKADCDCRVEKVVTVENEAVQQDQELIQLLAGTVNN